MFDELLQDLSPEMQTLLQEGGLVLIALLGGHFLGTLAARALGTRNFDAALRLPGPVAPKSENDHGFTPTVVAGLFIRLTVWTAAAWWLANRHGYVELASTLGLILRRSWALAGVLVAALGLASLLARRVMECLQGISKPGAEIVPGRTGAVAAAVGAGAYGLTVLLVLLMAADIFDWPLTRSAAQALWSLAQHLLTAGTALFIGCLGARWAREQVTTDSAASPEKRAGQFTALAMVAGTTTLAVAVVLSSAGLLIGLAVLALLGGGLWLVRGYLPDVTAGLQLRAHQVREVWLDGVAWQVVEIGLLTTQVTRAGEFYRLPNHVVLQARLHGAPKEAPAR
jgi:hypothetical protein